MTINTENTLQLEELNKDLTEYQRAITLLNMHLKSFPIVTIILPAGSFLFNSLTSNITRGLMDAMVSFIICTMVYIPATVIIQIMKMYLKKKMNNIEIQITDIKSQTMENEEKLQRENQKDFLKKNYEKEFSPEFQIKEDLYNSCNEAFGDKPKVRKRIL